MLMHMYYVEKFNHNTYSIYIIVFIPYNQYINAIDIVRVYCIHAKLITMRMLPQYRLVN